MKLYDNKTPLRLSEFLNLLVGCLEKFHQLVSQMVALMFFFYHGRIRKKHHQLQKTQVESPTGWWFQPI